MSINKQNDLCGYGVFAVFDMPDVYLWGMPHIQKIDDLDVFDNDVDATHQAIEDGYDIIWYGSIGYIDTPEVRSAIAARTGGKNGK